MILIFAPQMAIHVLKKLVSSCKMCITIEAHLIWGIFGVLRRRGAFFSVTRARDRLGGWPRIGLHMRTTLRLPIMQKTLR
jgi:hypothetical protein